MNFGKIFLLAFVCFCWTNKAKAIELSIGTSIWPPYINDDNTGLAVDKIEQIAKHLQLKTDYKAYPFKRLYLQVVAGRLPVGALLSRDAQREKELYFSKPLFCDRRYIYALSPLKGGADFKELERTSIGAGLAINYGDNFEQQISRHSLKVEHFPSPQMLIKVLDANRVQSVILSEREANVLLQHKQTLNPTYRTKNAFSQMPLHLAFPKTNEGKKLAKKLNSSIETLGLMEDCTQPTSDLN